MPGHFQQQQQQQSTNDLRSHATDQKRGIEFKHKWSPKWATGSHIPTVKLGPNNTKRPRRLASQGSGIVHRQREEKLLGKRHAEGKQDVLGGGRRGATIESSTDDDEDHSSHTSESPEPEFEGEDGLPATGQVILGLALSKALERFDHQSLMKLVKEEYEVLDDVDEDGHGVKVARGDFDDDFELV